MNLPNMLEAKKRTNKKTKYYNYSGSNKYDLKGKKFYLKTYGCQMNIHDSEKIKGILIENNAIETDKLDECDIVILNTCAIRENAHDKVFGFLGKIKHLKEQKKIVLGICGCMAQESGVIEEILKKRPYVDFIIGTHNIDDLIPSIKSVYTDENKAINVFSIEGNVCEEFPHKRDSEYTAWVDIQLGCDKFCTYCIVPYTRGKQRSRKKEEILREIEFLKSHGYKEVTLLGQNVNAYGKDLYENYNLASLLEDVSNIGVERIRFVTSHPWDFTDEMIEVIAEKNNIMPYIHLPIQSGSNRILKLMGRRYTKEEYLTLYNKIKSKIKNCSVTTDIIVGFPGETEEDFNETLEIVEKCKFDGAFTFIYSPRENTPASKMLDTLSDEEKHSRLKALNLVVNKYSNLSNKKNKNKIVRCLVVGSSDKDKSKLTGYTEDMKLVNIDGDIKNIGQIVSVKITDTKSFSMDGVII